MVDTFEELEVREEYKERIEILLSKTHQLEHQLQKIIKEKDEYIRAQHDEYEQGFNEQFNQILQLSQKLEDYVRKHDRKLSDKDREIESLRQLISELRNKGNTNVDQLRREKEVQFAELKRAADAQIEQAKRQYENDLFNLQQNYDDKCKELEQAKKNVARSISNRRNSISSSQGDTNRRHSSARASRHRSSRNVQNSSFTVESRYPVKRKGIGEQTPPKLDLDHYPTKEGKHDRSIRTIKLNQGHSGNFIRFRDQVYYEQRIKELEEQILKQKEKQR